MKAVYLLGGTHAGETIEVPDGERSLFLNEELRIATIDELDGHQGTRRERYDFLMERGGLTIFSAEGTEWREASAARYMLARGLLKLSDATNDELLGLKRDIDPETDIGPPLANLDTELKRRGLS